MNKPPINALIGCALAAIAAFQPLITINTDKIILNGGPSWGLLIWGGVAVVLGLYGRKRREYIGPGLLLAIIPFFQKFAIEAQATEQFHLNGVQASYTAGAFMAWGAAICVLSVAFGKDPEVPADDAPAAKQ
jgi:hypothetical protein